MRCKIVRTQKAYVAQYYEVNQKSKNFGFTL